LVTDGLIWRRLARVPVDIRTVEPSLAPRSLTPTEQAIVDYIAQGMVDAEIAVRLGLATSDVKHRITRMLQDFRLLHRRDLARWDPSQPPPPLEATDVRRGWPRMAATAGAILGVTLMLSFFLLEDGQDDAPRYEPGLVGIIRSDGGASGTGSLRPGHIILTSPPERWIPASVVPSSDGAENPGGTLAYGTDVSYDGGLDFVIIAEDDSGEAVGIDRVNSVVTLPLFRPPEGGTFRSGASDPWGRLLAAAYSHNAGRWLVWSVDGGATWSEPRRVRNNETAVGVVSSGVLVSTAGGSQMFALGFAREIVTFEGERIPFTVPGNAVQTTLGELAPGQLAWPGDHYDLYDETGSRVLTIEPPFEWNARITGFLSDPDGRPPRVFTARSFERNEEYVFLLEPDGEVVRIWNGNAGYPVAASGRYVIMRDCATWTDVPRCTVQRFDTVTGTVNGIVGLPYEGLPNILAVVSMASP
jgi:DNA-binding CsgD family transcriptional regulator